MNLCVLYAEKVLSWYFIGCKDSSRNFYFDKYVTFKRRGWNLESENLCLDFFFFWKIYII